MDEVHRLEALVLFMYNPREIPAPDRAARARREALGHGFRRRGGFEPMSSGATPSTVDSRRFEAHTSHPAHGDSP